MKIKFLPQDIEVEATSGQSILNVAQENGVSIRSVCKGVPSCAECRVKIVEGINNVLPPMDAELDLIGTAHFVDNSRLACQMRCFGDLVINLEEHVGKSMGNAKQPRGGMKKEHSVESKARMGNVLEEAGAPAVEIEMTEEERKEAANLKVKSKDKNVAYTKKLSAGGSSKPKPKSNNKNRNRNNKNRNRNKNNSAGPKSGGTGNSGGNQNKPKKSS